MTCRRDSTRHGLPNRRYIIFTQLELLILVNAFVGAAIEMERSILPAIAEEEFAMVAGTEILSFIAAFGLTKAITNHFAGRLAVRCGRRSALIGGLVALPVPFCLGMGFALVGTVLSILLVKETTKHAAGMILSQIG